MEPFKNIYNKKSLAQFAAEIKKVHNDFKSDLFIKSLFPEIETMEMKDRVRLISEKLWLQLNLSYPKAIKTLMKTVSEKGNNGFIAWPISQFIESYGLEHYSESMNALKKLTTHFTSEFCLRPFIQHYDQKVFDDLLSWRQDKNHHIRRLVSEGTRPNLPWGQKVQSINENLERNIDLISHLRSDSSEYVRRSVANHLNDISRLNPKLYFKTIDTFKEKTPEVKKVIRHSARTLLKAGDKKALKIHGYKVPKSLKLDVRLEIQKVKEGEYLPVTIIIENESKNAQKILIDYIISYVKKDGTHSDKVFRLRDTVIETRSKNIIKKKISFKSVTTRKHYPGKHFLSLQINGKIFDKKSFDLIL